MRRQVQLCAILVGYLTVAASAQVAAPPPPLATVEAAEADGARHPRAVGTMQAMYGEANGPTERKCVDAEKYLTARSGEFVAGPFSERVIMVGSGRKVWWAPRQTVDFPPMLLRATKLGAPNVTVNWVFSSVAYNDNGSFYNTTFLFPEAGRWLTVVTAGNNWGCFILDEKTPVSN